MQRKYKGHETACVWLFNEHKKARVAEAEWLWGKDEVRESCLAGMDEKGD